MLETLNTMPSGARLPKQICMSANALNGASGGAISCWPGGGAGTSARFSASVRPLTVRQSPSSSPACSRCFSSTGVPPMRCRSTIVCLPRGAKLQQHRRAAEDGLQIAQRERDVGFARQGQQVQNAVGRTADGGDRGRGVFEGPPRQDVARPDVALQQLAHGGPRPGTPGAWPRRRRESNC